MTRYTVVWSTEAENYLATIWVDHADHRQAIASAANAIDSQLATDPSTKGTALKEGLRALDVPPLHVLFEVSELDRIVHVVKAGFLDHSPRRHEGNGEGLSLPSS